MNEHSFLAFGAILTIALLLSSSPLQVQASKPTSSVTPTIQLIQCNGGNAKWNGGSGTVTYTIENLAGFSSTVVDDVQAAINEWSNTQSTYTLSSTSGTPDIVIKLYDKITPGFILGETIPTCDTGNNLASVEIDLGLKGLSNIGIQNVAAHEFGHALGLGHANLKGDLMYASFDSSEERKNIFCPSNLDVGGLTATSNPYTVSSWTRPSSC